MCASAANRKRRDAASRTRSVTQISSAGSRSEPSRAWWRGSPRRRVRGWAGDGRGCDHRPVCHDIPHGQLIRGDDFRFGQVFLDFRCCAYRPLDIILRTPWARRMQWSTRLCAAVPARRIHARSSRRAGSMVVTTSNSSSSSKSSGGSNCSQSIAALCRSPGATRSASAVAGSAAAFCDCGGFFDVGQRLRSLFLLLLRSQDR